MLDKLKKQIAVEKKLLSQLLQLHRPLVEKCADIVPNPIELSALAAMLHSFYTGMENIFKRIAVELDGGPPRGEFWHVQLLDNMTHPGRSRPTVISQALKETLRGYLDFRHVFRHAYSFELKWTRMAGLVQDCEKTLKQLELELEAFLESFKPSNP